MLQQVDRATQRGHVAMKAMLDHARLVLGSLQNGGSKARNLHLSFEAGLSILIPDDATQLHVVSEISRLLDVDRGAVIRTMKRGRKKNDEDFDGFVSVLFSPRKRRKDFVQLGRQVSAEFWHAMTRLDTRPGT